MKRSSKKIDLKQHVSIRFDQYEMTIASVLPLDHLHAIGESLDVVHHSLVVQISIIQHWID